MNINDAQNLLETATSLAAMINGLRQELFGVHPEITASEKDYPSYAPGLVGEIEGRISNTLTVLQRGHRDVQFMRERFGFVEPSPFEAPSMAGLTGRKY